MALLLHQVELSELVERLATDIEVGLTEDEADQRIQREGPNVYEFRQRQRPFGASMHITVIRGGQLSMGNIIPADMRVIKSQGLMVEMRLVNGSFAPVPRSSRCTDDNPVRSENMLFCGSTVVEGSAVAVVTATGNHTYIAELDQMTVPIPRKHKNKTPCMPAKYMARTLRHNVNVKKKEALITMRDLTHLVFSLSYLCERGRMDAADVFVNNQVVDVTSVRSQDEHTTAVRALATCAVVNSGAVISGGTAIGVPTEAGLVQYFSQILDVEATRKMFPILAVKPFQPSLKFTASLHAIQDTATSEDGPAAQLVALKGAPEVVLSRCSSLLVNNEEVPLDDAMRAAIDKHIHTLSGQGKTVLGFARKRLTASEHDAESDFPIQDLTFVGMVSLLLRLRSGVNAAVQRCASYGVTPVLFSGAHPALVKAIARRVGIFSSDTSGMCVTGSTYITDFSAVLSSRKQVAFARVNPTDKLRLVEALQASGCVVGITGDHPNDASALEQADVGFASGISGTEICQEKSSCLVLDDSFISMVEAIAAVKQMRPRTCVLV